MSHPLTNNRQTLLVLFLVWIVLMAVHAFVLYAAWENGGMWPFFDALIHLSVFIPLAFALWYPVRFSSVSDGRLRPDYANLIFSVAVVLLLWLAASYGLMRLFCPDQGYFAFYHASLLLRFAFAVLVSTFVCLIYLLITYYSGYEKMQQERNKLQASFKNVQLSFLQSQINPHFLFNALNGVNSLIISDPLKAQELVVELSGFLRYTLKQGHQHFHLLSDEIKNMERFLAIEQIRYGNRLDYSIQYDQKVSKASVPALIMLPLLENAIKFSLHQTTNIANIKCKIFLKDEELKIEMINNFDADDLTNIHGTGTGLRNIASRLELLFGKSGLLKYECIDGDFIVELTVPQYINAAQLS